MTKLLQKFTTFLLLAIFISATLIPSAQSAYYGRRTTTKKAIPISKEVGENCKIHLSKLSAVKDNSKLAFCKYEKPKTISEKNIEFQPFMQKIGYVYKILLKLVFIWIFGFSVFKVFTMHKDDLSWGTFKNIGIALFIMSFSTLVLEYTLGDEFALIDVNKNHNYVNCTKPTQLYRRCSSRDANAIFIKKKYIISEAGHSLVDYNIKDLDKNEENLSGYSTSPRTLF